MTSGHLCVKGRFGFEFVQVLPKGSPPRVILLLAGIAVARARRARRQPRLPPAVGPLALLAAFEPHLLVIGAGVGAHRDAPDDHRAGTRQASGSGSSGIVVIVVALVRVGGEWWSPDDEPARVIPTAATTRLAMMSWNLEVGLEGAGADASRDPRPAGPRDARRRRAPGADARRSRRARGRRPRSTPRYPYRILEPTRRRPRDGHPELDPAGRGRVRRVPDAPRRADLLLPDDSRRDAPRRRTRCRRRSRRSRASRRASTRGSATRSCESLRASVDRARTTRPAWSCSSATSTPRRSSPASAIVADGLATPTRIGSRDRVHVAAGVPRAAQRRAAPDRPRPRPGPAIAPVDRGPRTARSPATTAASRRWSRCPTPTRSGRRRSRSARGGRRR